MPLLVLSQFQSENYTGQTSDTIILRIFQNFQNLGF